MATLAEISAAAADPDLLSRVISAAAEAGISAPQQWAETNIRAIVTKAVTGGSDTIASVYGYAVATYTPAPRPGENPAAVTDEYIRTAVAAANS